jgi:hypothetical protein
MVIYHLLNKFATNHPGVLFLVTAAAIFAMPAKDAQWSWRIIYGFFFDWFHGIIGNRYQPVQSTQSFTITPQKTEATSTTSEPLPKQS